MRLVRLRDDTRIHRATREGLPVLPVRERGEERCGGVPEWFHTGTED